jgi:hypothetical protein
MLITYREQWNIPKAVKSACIIFKKMRSLILSCGNDLIFWIGFEKNVIRIGHSWMFFFAPAQRVQALQFYSYKIVFNIQSNGFTKKHYKFTCLERSEQGH